MWIGREGIHARLDPCRARLSQHGIGQCAKLGVQFSGGKRILRIAADKHALLDDFSSFSGSSSELDEAPAFLQ